MPNLSISNDVTKHCLLPFFSEDEKQNLAQVDNSLYQIASSTLDWQKKLESQVRDHKGFSLSGFDAKTMFLINKTDIESIKNTAQKVKWSAVIFLGALANALFVYDFYNSFSGDWTMISSFCDSPSNLLTIPCDGIGIYLALTYRITKTNILFSPLTMPLLIAPFETVREKIIKVASYIAQTSYAPNRELPVYASCLEKMARCWNKMKSFSQSAVV